MPNIEPEFITTTSILTFGGASVVVWLFSATIRRLLRLGTLWVPFLVSLIVAGVVAWQTEALSSPLEWLVALANCCLLFCTATGLNETAEGLVRPQPAGETRTHSKKPRKWLESWLHFTS